ncbi:Uncharacterised protein [Mycobacteroides abscessus subsp. bolletii]|nr:Uncharacterised protein [Mycobacteroides abscessus subsp. bolletii]
MAPAILVAFRDVSGLEFAARLVEAAIWPVVVMVLVFVLRDQIKSATNAFIARIADITDVSARGFALKLEKKVREVHEKTETLADTATEHDSIASVEKVLADLPPETPPERVDRFQRLAAENPKAAVLVAFSEFENLVRRIYWSKYGNHDQFIPFAKMLSIFKHDQVMPPIVIEGARELSQIRNELTHSAATISAETALNYGESLGNLIKYWLLSELPGEDNDDGGKSAGDESTD